MWFTRPQDLIPNWFTAGTVTVAGIAILAGPFAGYLAPGSAGEWASVLFLGLLLALGGGAWSRSEFRKWRS